MNIKKQAAKISIATAIIAALLGGFMMQKAGAASTNITACGSLGQANETYTLQNDVTASGTCFTINANGIVLDLNGHTVTYNDQVGDNMYGILITWNKAGVRITNGSLVQGAGNGYKSSAIYSQQGNNLEIDHLTIRYQGDDITGIFLNGGGYAKGANIHDNFIYPNGTKRADPVLGYPTHYGGFGAISVSTMSGTISVVNNIIEGKGVNGIGYGYPSAVPATSSVKIMGNTIKMASPVRDGYAVAIGSASNVDINFEIANNTIMQSSGRGILVAGNLNADSPGPGMGTIHNNFIDVRESRDAGEYAAPGTAVGIQLRFGAHDTQIYNNTVLAHAGLNACPAQFPTSKGNDCIGIGIKVIGGKTAVNNQVFDNTIVVDTTDPSAALTATGLYGSGVSNGSNVFYGNTVTSNSIIIDLNGSDGAGSNFMFRSNTFIKGMSPQNFHSIRVGYWVFNSIENVFLDNGWQNGAGLDDLIYSGGINNGIVGNYSLYSKWYLNVSVKDDITNAPISGATVVAAATGTNETVSAVTDALGGAQLVLTDYKRYGVTYPATSSYIRYNPYTITVTKAGYGNSIAGVTVDGTKSISMLMGRSTLISDTTPPAAPMGLAVN